MGSDPNPTLPCLRWKGPSQQYRTRRCRRETPPPPRPVLRRATRAGASIVTGRRKGAIPRNRAKPWERSGMRPAQGRTGTIGTGRPPDLGSRRFSPALPSPPPPTVRNRFRRRRANQPDRIPWTRNPGSDFGGVRCPSRFRHPLPIGGLSRHPRSGRWCPCRALRGKRALPPNRRAYRCGSDRYRWRCILLPPPRLRPPRIRRGRPRAPGASSRSGARSTCIATI